MKLYRILRIRTREFSGFGGFDGEKEIFLKIIGFSVSHSVKQGKYS